MSHPISTPLQALVNQIETHKDFYMVLATIQKMGAKSIDLNDDRATSFYWFATSMSGLLLNEAIKDPDGLPHSWGARAMARLEDLVEAETKDEIDQAIEGAIQ